MSRIYLKNMVGNDFRIFSIERKYGMKSRVVCFNKKLFGLFSAFYHQLTLTVSLQYQNEIEKFL